MSARQPPLIFEDFPPAEAWGEFKKMRKQLKKPMTPYAETLMVKRLRAYVDNGQDAQAMLDQSILHGWTNVYEVKTEQQAARHSGAPHLSLVQQNADSTAEAMRILDQANFDAMRTVDER